MSAHSQYLAERHFGSLDGLRALSIIAVIWHHTAPREVPTGLAHVGAEGVTLFFAISGFLITSLLLRERDQKWSNRPQGFLCTKVVRIFSRSTTLSFCCTWSPSGCWKRTPMWVGRFSRTSNTLRPTPPTSLFN